MDRKKLDKFELLNSNKINVFEVWKLNLSFLKTHKSFTKGWIWLLVLNQGKECQGSPISVSLSGYCLHCLKFFLQCVKCLGLKFIKFSVLNLRSCRCWTDISTFLQIRSPPPPFLFYLEPWKIHFSYIKSWQFKFSIILSSNL